MSHQNQPIIAATEPKNVDVFIMGPPGVGKQMFIRTFRKQLFQLAMVPAPRKNIEIHGRRYNIKTIAHTDLPPIPSLVDPENWEAFILMFDVNRPETLDQAVGLWKDLQPRLKFNRTPWVRCLVGNKADCRSQATVALSQRASRVAQGISCQYFEVSALQARNMEDVFAHLIFQWETSNVSSRRSQIAAPRVMPPPPHPLHITTADANMPTEVRVAIVGEVFDLVQANFAQMFTLGLPDGAPIEDRGSSPWSTELKLGASRVTLRVQNAHGECPAVGERRPGHPGSKWIVDDVDAFIVLFDTAVDESRWHAQARCRKIVKHKAATRSPDSQAPLPTPVVLIALERDSQCHSWNVNENLASDLAKPLGCASYVIDPTTMAAWEVIEGLKKSLTLRVIRGRENTKRLVEIPVAKGSHQQAEPSQRAPWRLSMPSFGLWGRGGESCADEAIAQANEK